MLSRETTQKLAAKYQTTEQNIFREYFQHLFLAYFYQRKETETVYFKGGTALRIIYQSPRFSEDLDFSASLKNIDLIEEAVLETLSEIEKEAIGTEIAESKETSGGYLAVINFEHNGQVIAIQLEISFRQENEEGEVVSIASDFMPIYTIQQLRREKLIDEKLEALLSRKKPRDFYDLYFILRANLLSVEKRPILEKILEILEKSDIYFERELREFLPQNQWGIIRNFKASLDREIRRFI